MSEQIIEIFHNKILPSAREKDPTYVGDWPFFVNFDSNIDGNQEFNSKLVINIKDEDAFNEALVDYTLTMLEHLMNNVKLQEYDNVYFEGNLSNIIESIVLNVWFNATEEDFKDPIKFLKTRKAFLTDELSNNNLNKIWFGQGLEKLNNSCIKSTIDIQNPSNNETFFVFRSKIVNGEDEFLLPNISYGICEGKCYIYAVHGNKCNLNTPYEKKINRLLYKANNDLVDTYDEENIKDVTLSHVFALTILFKMLKDNDITDVVVKNFYPVRADNKDVVINNKINKLKKLEPSLDDPKYADWEKSINDLSQEVDRIQSNIINKYLRNFRRLEHHFSNINVVSYPYEVDNNMHIKLTDYKDYESEHILNQVYESIEFSKKYKK